MDLSYKIQDLLRRKWNVKFALVNREANSAADWMAKKAKKGAHSDSDYFLWTAPGVELDWILHQEAA
ncbi:hypothetical protein PIB30_091589, partial [Stylosanthes scabra]|nr:hypothetical protein [Stylosanthes scabra]